MIRFRNIGQPLLIESTVNQVNQYGGYTGMTPRDFVAFIYDLAQQNQFSRQDIILGGDHLGPLPWSRESSEKAMLKAKRLVADYVSAGYRKIHLDTSMHMGDDDITKKLDLQIIAARGAELAAIAEKTFASQGINEKYPPVYIIGSEVPVPGGSSAVASQENELLITSPADFQETVDIYSQEFRKKSLESAWERVVAVVVQPGVEFGDQYVINYNREKASALLKSLHSYSDLVFEGHSTDYQTRESLQNMVSDGIAILKVGPGLTFSAREAMFALAHIENELARCDLIKEPSCFSEILDNCMFENKSFWQKYVGFSHENTSLFRKYSLTDRSRYYMNHPDVQAAQTKLIDNLTNLKIPYGLLSQYLPLQYRKIRNGSLTDSPRCIIYDSIANMLDDYIYATV